MTKYLFLLYGTPASGKSFLAEKIIKENFGKEIYDNLIKVNIDEIVESNSEYKEEIKKCIGKEKMTSEDMANCNNIYDKYRKITNAEKISSELFNNAISSNQNIIAETTSGQWFVDEGFKYAKEKGYYIVIIFPYVDNIDELYKRSLNRGKITGRFINREVIENIKKKVDENIVNVINNANKMYIYDNNVIEDYNALKYLLIKSDDTIMCKKNKYPTLDRVLKLCTKYIGGNDSTNLLLIIIVLIIIFMFVLYIHYKISAVPTII